MTTTTSEQMRLTEAYEQQVPWLLWGPYLSERQWGTVREDYSADGAAWDYLPHDQARSKTYRWGEDGLAGICDENQRLCFAIALWNENDPILKERLFGLTNNEGNHGEDVKEYYFYLDSTPTHSYMKMLYKYPHQSYPYGELVAVNRQRKQTDPGSFEYELLDSGAFADNRYTDVLVEYAKRTPADILIRISLTNRGTKAKTLHVLPTLWFRNTWSWQPNQLKPELRQGQSSDPATAIIEVSHSELGNLRLYGEAPKQLLFVENETNFQRLFGSTNTTPYPKDGINDYVVSDRKTVNPDQTGTKAAAHYGLSIEPGQTQTIRLRLTDASALENAFGQDFEKGFAQRIQEADAFYGELAGKNVSTECRTIQRQALAGMLWSKQFYYYVIEPWLQGDPNYPPPPRQRLQGRNSKWIHVHAEDILSMPDKWEYPWFASWDLCFHAVVLALVDPAFAKRQLHLLTREWYMNPEGQVPAYEWAFDDVNPPVQAWAAWRVYQLEKDIYGRGDKAFLKQMFEHCLLYFTWWVNRKDAAGNNLFQGGFLGLDNIGIFDRNQIGLPPGARLYQSDGTSWMGLFALRMLKIALELATEDPHYLDFAGKFFQHFLYIADAMNHVSHISQGEIELWDEEDGFFYDVLGTADQRFVPIKMRSLVGLMPLLPVEAIDLDLLESDTHARFRERYEGLVQHRPRLVNQATSHGTPGKRCLLLSFIDESKLRLILKRMLDEKEFLSPHGIRSISKVYGQQPYTLQIDGHWYSEDYEPAESTTAAFGGNSNWRGPVWFPVNFLLIESLRTFHRYFGDDFKIECPTGSGQWMTLAEVADEISRRLIAIFERDDQGNRPVYGGTKIFQKDAYWQDYLSFYEYFHGDNGAGLGASHQTGWTGLVANLIYQQQARIRNK